MNDIDDLERHIMIWFVNKNILKTEIIHDMLLDLLRKFKHDIGYRS